MNNIFSRLKSEDADARKTTVIVLLFSAGSAFVAALANISPQPLFIAGGVLVICTFMAWKYYLKPSRWLALSVSYVTLAYLIFRNLGIRDTSMFALAAFLIAAGLLEGKRGVLIFGTLIVALIGGIDVAEMQGIIRNKFSPFNGIADYIAAEIGFILISVLLWFVINQLNQSVEKARHELTDRLNVEQKLRESETRYRELVENLPVVIYAAEPGTDGRWRYVSPKILELTGYEPDLWLADPNFWFKHIHPDDQVRIIQEEADALEKSQMPVLEYRFQHRDGRMIWIQDQSLKIMNPENQKIYLQGFMLDITARKQAEDFLKASEEKYHVLFNTAFRQAQELSLLSQVQSTLAREVDLRTILRIVVEAIAETYGYTLVSLYLLKGQALYLQHQVGYTHTFETVPISKGVLGKVVRTRKPILIQDPSTDPDFLEAVPGIKSEICVPLFDGKEVCGVLNIESAEDLQLTDDDLKMMATLSEQINIAIRRARLYDERAESLKREERLNEFTRAITSSLDLPVILKKMAQLSAEMIGAETGTVSIMSDDGSVMVDVYNFNERSDVNSGPLPKGQGLSWFTFETGDSILLDEYSEHPNALPEWQNSGVHAYIAAPITMADQRLGVLAMYNRDSEKKFTARDLILFEAMARQTAVAIQNARLYKALQDELEEHKRTQVERERLIQELGSKNAELERFTYTVSHDLKAPLVTIRGFMGLLEEDAIKGNIERIHQDAKRITEAALKMQRLLNELLELSRIGRLSNPSQSIPFDVIVREALSLLEGTLTSRQIKVEAGSDLPMVYGDRVRLIEVVQNLVDNAVKFMGNQPNPKIEIGVVKQNEESCFFVRDNGLGLEPQFHEKIFGLFNKLDPGSEGTGVGLALVKRIIEIHQGRIWVESAGIGKGTTFWFTLPNMPDAK